MNNERVSVTRPRVFHEVFRYPEIAKLLVQDGRINVNEKNLDGHTALKYACFLSVFGALLFLKILISSGRFIDTQTTNLRGVKETAKILAHQEMLALIESYETNRDKTVDLVRKSFGMQSLTKQQKFIYFCCDGEVNLLKKLIYRNKKVGETKKKKQK